MERDNKRIISNKQTKVWTLILLFFLFCNFSYSQTFEKLIATDKDDYVSDAFYCTDGSVIFELNSGSYYEKRYEEKLFKMDNSGNMSDSVKINIPEGYISQGGTKIEKINDTLLVTIFVCKELQQNVKEYYIVEFDCNLNIINKKMTNFQVPEKYMFTNFIINSDTNIVLLGTEWADFYYFIYEFTFEGALITNKTYQNISSTLTAANAIIEINSQNKYHIFINLYPQKFLVINKDDYEIDTVLSYPGSFEPFGSHIPYNTNNTYIVTGRNYIGNSVDTPAFLEMDDTGNVLSLNYYTASADTNSGNTGKTFDFNGDKIYMATAYNFKVEPTYPFVDRQQWIWLNSINTDYSIKWQKFYKGEVNYMPSKVLATNDGGAIIFSTKYDWNSPIPLQRDLHILKVDSTGWYDGLTNVDTEQDMPKQILVYPNPATGKVHFVTGFYNNLELRIYDIQGNEVLTQHLPFSQTVDIGYLKPGLYLYLLIGENGFSEKGKITIKK